MVKDGIFLGKRYEVLEKIGAGGMADVYKGRDCMLNRYVAIKVLKKEFREDENFVKKFRSEAQAAAGLLNPNIVNVYDVGEDRGLYYMVMELVEGITLKEYIEKKGRLSAREVISIAIQMCMGIEAAHRQNIIHRDIKPQNIIISNSGKVKVTDFGIARMVTSSTVSTTAMGSVHYTSPEQARGGYSDEKSDIYSVGITLYEMVTGHVPFDGETTVEVAMKHLEEEITPPSEYVPDIPYSLEQIILKCTQKNTGRRYNDIAELLRDLKHSLVDPDGDFVYIGPAGSEDTSIISEEELDNIRSAYGDSDDDYEGDPEEYEYDEYGYDKNGHRRRRYDNDRVNPNMNRLIKILTIAVAVIAMIVLAVVAGRAAGLFKVKPAVTAEENKDEVKVPDVRGKTLEEAKDILNEKNLGYKLGEEIDSNKYDKGEVAKQSPASGDKVKKNTQILLQLSTGASSEEKELPDVTGMDEEEALKTLNDAGFTNVTSEAAYSSKAQGQVLETDPKAGEKVKPDEEIVMKVSKGQEQVEVPYVIGYSENDAKEILRSADLIAGEVTTSYSDEVAEGEVMAQTPDGGKRVRVGTTVNIVVSLGPSSSDKDDDTDDGNYGGGSNNGNHSGGGNHSGSSGGSSTGGSGSTGGGNSSGSGSDSGNVDNPGGGSDSGSGSGSGGDDNPSGGNDPDEGHGSDPEDPDKETEDPADSLDGE